MGWVAMLAVTTRNVLRSSRLGLPMLVARGLVARQLTRAPGLVRYAGGVAGAREFLTLTVWEDRRQMQAFMQSGAHERVMWLFAQWTESFWGMRWEPGAWEQGDWLGERLSAGMAAGRVASPLVQAGLLPAEVPRAGPTGPRRESGGVEPRNCGLVAVTARIQGERALRLAVTLRERLRQTAQHDTDLVRWAVGLDFPPQVFAVSLWKDSGAQKAADALGKVDWAMRWLPGDYEIGHWEGLRLRQVARLSRTG